MKIDGGMRGGLDTATAVAADLERRGYDGVMTAETSHDPFLPLLLAAQDTERVDLMTSIAVAFARSPMTLAQTAWDLQSASHGRFILGLGSQIKPHITRRFSMPWSHPAARMREMILAIRAIWACWNDGTKLDFRGDFYTHTLMTPFFNPGPNPHGDARIFLAGVGELMTEVAGEVADGFICHGFTTRRYLDEVTLPALEKALRLPAKNAAEATVRVVRRFAEERQAGESFRAWMDRAGGAKAIAAELKELDRFPLPDEAPEYYVDYDETGPYEAEVGVGECAGA